MWSQGDFNDLNLIYYRIFVVIFLCFRLQDMSVDQFREIRAKAGGLIILLPENLAALSFEEKQVINYIWN